MTPAEKRATWRRITREGTAWRFNRYAERARRASGTDHPDPTSFAERPSRADDRHDESARRRTGRWRPSPRPNRLRQAGSGAIDPLAASARQIAPLAWPVFIGQISVVAFGTVDTLLVARHSAADLAALAVGAAAYITVFIGLMGIVIAVAPIAGQAFGARRLARRPATSCTRRSGSRSA